MIEQSVEDMGSFIRGRGDRLGVEGPKLMGLPQVQDFSHNAGSNAKGCLSRDLLTLSLCLRRVAKTAILLPRPSGSVLPRRMAITRPSRRAQLNIVPVERRVPGAEQVLRQVRYDPFQVGDEEGLFLRGRSSSLTRRTPAMPV